MVSRHPGPGRVARAPSGRPAAEHDVKSWPAFFGAMLRGEKAFDLRRATDRDYRVGDVLRMREYDPATGSYSGREQRAEITYVTSAGHPCALSGDGLAPGFCILGFRRLGRMRRARPTAG